MQDKPEFGDVFFDIIGRPIIIIAIGKETVSFMGELAGNKGVCFGGEVAIEIVKHYTYLGNIRHLKTMREALEEWIKWEAELLLTDKVWENGLPVFTQEIYDKYIELQKVRTQALAETEAK